MDLKQLNKSYLSNKTLNITNKIFKIHKNLIHFLITFMRHQFKYHRFQENR